MGTNSCDLVMIIGGSLQQNTSCICTRPAFHTHRRLATDPSCRRRRLAFLNTVYTANAFHVSYMCVCMCVQVRVYNEKQLVSIHQTNDLVVGMRFGRFGREDNTLISTHASGALSIKILPRRANLEASANGTGPPPEQVRGRARDDGIGPAGFSVAEGIRRHDLFEKTFFFFESNQVSRTRLVELQWCHCGGHVFCSTGR